MRLPLGMPLALLLAWAARADPRGARHPPRPRRSTAVCTTFYVCPDSDLNGGTLYSMDVRPTDSDLVCTYSDPDQTGSFCIYDKTTGVFDAQDSDPTCETAPGCAPQCNYLCPAFDNMGGYLNDAYSQPPYLGCVYTDPTTESFCVYDLSNSGSYVPDGGDLGFPTSNDCQSTAVYQCVARKRSVYERASVVDSMPRPAEIQVHVQPGVEWEDLEDKHQPW